MPNHQSKALDYSHSEIPVDLDPEFPISMFQWSVEQEPIRDLHAHNVLEMGICLRGNGIFVIDNTIQPYERGDVAAIGPGVYHRAKSGFGVHDLWFFVFLNPSHWSARPYPATSARLFARPQTLISILSWPCSSRSPYDAAEQLF